MADDPDLFGSDDGSQGDDERAPSGFFDAVAAAGERRGVGRPRGARNRKSVDFEKWFYAMGYRDPAQVLAEIITMDPRALQAMAAENAEGLPRTTVGELTMVSLPSIPDIIDLQRKAAVDLMPYLHGKKPTEVVVTDERLPILVVASGTNQMAEAAKLIEGRAVMSVGQMPEASEINDLEGDE